jgi:two-component system, cell cycle response regulator
MTARDPSKPPALRVLVVDDDKAIQELYRIYLRRRNCSCDIAASGREALLVLMKQNFDVLIVDLRMENMDGLVFLQEALKIWPWLAVVISSGFITQDVLDRAAELGITRVIKKSEKMDVLLDSVFEAASERRAAVGDVVEDNALRLMRAHMRMMTRLTQNHAEMDVLVEELSEFGRMLSEILSSELSGILIYRKDKHTLVLASSTPLGNRFSDCVADEMVTRFNTLSGNSITLADVHLGRLHDPGESDSPSTPGKMISVPVIMGNDISGILTLAAEDSTPYSREDVSLFYHAANHVSALFITLQEIHALAAHDALTGLYNRLRLDEELTRAWGLCERHGHTMGVVILDLDNLKSINDTYGHAAGDEALREFSGIISDAARASDTVARYGGDEFVVVLPHLQEGGAMALAERIMEQTRTHTFCEKSLKLPITTTIGIVTTSASDPAESCEELMRRADEALYAAKRAGRNQIRVWEG